jgi:predicted phosphodiesterase
MKRILAVVCSHGKHIDPQARNAVLKFRDKFKPQTIVHLGDFCDTAAFRSGARETADSAEDVGPDIDGGLTFLAEIGATHVLCGNHEDRLWRMAYSPNAVIAYAAGKCIAAIEAHCKKLKAALIPYSGIHQQIKFGNFTFTHGTMYGENAIRDHAEVYGNVVHGHTHRPGIATGRRIDSPIGFGLGTLTKRSEMEYAKARRATLSWGQAFLWGEYNDRSAHLQLCLGPQEQNPQQPWRLP